MATQLPLELIPERRDPSPRELADRQGVIEEKKKQRGMKGAGAKNAEYREIARNAARAIVARDGDVDIDRVRFYLEERDVRLPWANWAGSVFAPREWVWTGKLVASKHKGSRARHVRVWRYVPEPASPGEE